MMHLDNREGVTNASGGSNEPPNLIIIIFFKV